MSYFYIKDYTIEALNEKCLEDGHTIHSETIRYGGFTNLTEACVLVLG